MADRAGSRDALTKHDIAIQLAVGSAIHGAHAALAELGGDAMVSDLEGRGHGFSGTLRFNSSK
jgi:hypothetical protein